MKRYLVINKDGHNPFYTDYFDPENHFNPEAGMTVVDLVNHTYTINGIVWLDIPDDHL